VVKVAKSGLKTREKVWKSWSVIIGHLIGLKNVKRLLEASCVDKSGFSDGSV